MEGDVDINEGVLIVKEFYILKSILKTNVGGTANLLALG